MEKRASLIAPVLLAFGLGLLLVFGICGLQSQAAPTQLGDGTYSVPVTLTGGSGRASIATPTTVKVKDGQTTATIVWSSSNYDKMTVGKTEYVPATTEGGSTFEIPVTSDTMKVKAETTAMGTPHTIDYEIVFDMDSAQKTDAGGVSMSLVAGAVVLLFVAGIAIGVISSRRKARR